MNASRARRSLLRRTLRRLPVSTLFVLVVNSGGDAGVFCYRMGVDIFSAGRARFSVPMSGTRNLLACSTLFSTFSARFSNLKD